MIRELLFIILESDRAHTSASKLGHEENKRERETFFFLRQLDPGRDIRPAVTVRGQYVAPSTRRFLLEQTDISRGLHEIL